MKCCIFKNVYKYRVVEFPICYLRTSHNSKKSMKYDIRGASDTLWTTISQKTLDQSGS